MPPESSTHPEIVVVGAGVIGLTTAVVLARAGWRTEVWTADDPAATPSARAGAVWTPLAHAPLADSVAWSRRSMDEFRALSLVPESGVSLAEGLHLTSPQADVQVTPMSRMLPELRTARPDELPPPFVSGLRYRIPRIDMTRYVPWLQAQLEDRGGRVHRYAVGSLAEPLAVAPVVVNASGLAARTLTPDPAVRTVFSQYVITANPGIKLVTVDATDRKNWVSILPHPDRVVLGGVRLTGREDDRPDREFASEVLRRCREIEPALVDTPLLRIDTGLLPSRPTMRVESERRPDGLVVHAYGHAAGGVTTSWGAADAVAALVDAG